MNNSIFIIVPVLALFIFLVIKMGNKSKKHKERLMSLIQESVDKHSLNLKKMYKSDDNKLLLSFDESKKKVFLINRDDRVQLIDFNMIQDCVLNIDGEEIRSSSATNIIAGAVLAGGIGALIGSTMKSKQKETINSMGLTLRINDLTNPTINIELAYGGLDVDAKGGSIEEWHNIFKVIIERNQK